MPAGETTAWEAGGGGGGGGGRQVYARYELKWDTRGEEMIHNHQCLLKLRSEVAA